METAIEIIWWVGLLGALIPPVVILKEVALVVRELRHILQLAQLTHRAAEGVAAHVQVVPQMGALAGPAEELSEALLRLKSAVAQVEAALPARGRGIAR